MVILVYYLEYNALASALDIHILVICNTLISNKQTRVN
jgi:hypothetical protein